MLTSLPYHLSILFAFFSLVTKNRENESNRIVWEKPVIFSFPKKLYIKHLMYNAYSIIWINSLNSPYCNLTSVLTLLSYTRGLRDHKRSAPILRKFKDMLASDICSHMSETLEFVWFPGHGEHQTSNTNSKNHRFLPD